MLLDAELRLRRAPHVRFAGQITGVEGYVESAAIGLLAGRSAAAELAGADAPPPPPTTALGALLTHITGGHLGAGATFQPMNVNFGLFPPLEGRLPRARARPRWSPAPAPTSAAGWGTTARRRRNGRSVAPDDTAHQHRRLLAQQAHVEPCIARVPRGPAEPGEVEIGEARDQQHAAAPPWHRTPRTPCRFEQFAGAAPDRRGGAGETVERPARQHIPRTDPGLGEGGRPAA